MKCFWEMGRFNPTYHHRRSIRLQDYDYTPCGLYFVTICTQNRQCFLGNIEDGTFYASISGRLAQQGLEEMAVRNPGVEIDSWVVMPNHVHFILEIRQQTQLTLGKLIRQFKYKTTKQINLLRGSPGIRIWQRNYYEHIIRDKQAYQNIQNYIIQNPTRWQTDKLNPAKP